MAERPDLLELYRMMVRIRRVEERLEELFRSGDAYGSLHLCIGQEATATGACAALRSDDYVTCTYRGHGAVLAKGVPVGAVLAELLGRETGCCRGRSGSMLLTDLSRGLLFSTGIVAGGIPIAVGAALSARLSGSDRVALTFFGDGATNQGVFHEALNMAGLWKTPCILFCENNQYAEMTPIREETSIERLVDRGAAYRIPGVVVDGNDVEAVYDVTVEAVARARAGDGPTFIEATTYRLTGHMFGDTQPYRSREEVDSWRARDPLLVARSRLQERGVGADTVTRIDGEVEAEINAALEA
ncbi:MAG: thiamine pyrophosphate-dependent dehydrogenase E1 component subunit alpha, partial [Thermodesulfobacteriota bacterium]